MRQLFAVILTLFICSTALAADYRGACRIAFHGDSTLHAFHGKASCQPFTVSIRDGVLHFPTVSVAVAGMDTDNKRRDNKMREMFEEQKYPAITGTVGPVALREIRAAANKGSDVSLQVPIKLKIRDIEKPVSAKVSNLVESGNRLSGDLAFTVSLAEYQLNPPRPLGMIKVDDKVSLTVTVTLSTE